MRKLWIILFVLFSFTTKAQLKKLQIKSPAKTHTLTNSPNVYFQGIADPSAFLLMNGKAIKIFSTGVFAAQIPIELGQNQIEISYGKGSDMTKILYTIEFKESTRPEETKGFEIETIKVLPGGEMWFQTDDILQVEVKATPGMNLTFLNEVFLHEVDSKFTGIKGIYRGTYKIQEADKFEKTTLKFKLTDPKSNQSVEKSSSEKITVLPHQRPLIGFTKQDRTPLNYGLGSDRLGGAKMGFLPPNIKLEIVGKMQGMYKIQLAKDVIAWVPDNQIEIPSGTHFKPTSLTGSWSVRPSNKGDLISIGLSEKLPFVSQMLENPSKIVIDIFGAASNSNWITQKENLKAIKNVWYEQLNQEVFRVHIELQQNQHWGHEINYIGNSLTIRVKPQPENLNLRNLTIALDAGHGANNSGAVGMTGVKEKDLNLIIVNLVKDQLEKKGAKVILTRPGDTYTNNTKRLEFLKEADPDLLISVHCNAAGNPLVNGASTYYRHQSFRPLSQFIYAELLKLDLNDFGNVGGFNFALNSPTEYPNTLVEVAFMSSPSDEEMLLNPDFQKDVANKIVIGLENFLRNVN